MTLFCCLPAGIVGIINASQANSKQAAGDHEGAMRAAGKAKQWCWIAVGAAGSRRLRDLPPRRREQRRGVLSSC